VEDIAAEPDVILEGREKSATVGLGMGALGAGLASISTRFVGRSTTRDPYSVLPDEQEAGGPVRKSTRRVGTGIRLVGPRNSSGNDKYAPVRLGCAIRPLSSAKDLRMSMLHDEDSRSFARAKEEDWVLPSDDSEDRWKPANSLLGQERATIEEEDPFEDDESLHPPLRGGPVPTPRDSRSDLDPFEDFTNRRSSYVEASGSGSGQYELSAFSPSDDFGLNALPTLPPTTQQSSDSSMPRSQRSGQTTSTSDVEEGVVHHAQIASLQTASTVSPVETAHLPIKRSESFFRRLAAGSITSLLSRQPINPRRELNIRDPAPLPTLWQVGSPNEPPYPPSSWDATALRPPQPSRTKGPSLTSLNSARSMRDMVIIQREQTNSSIETEAVIEMASPLLSEPERPVGSGHHRHGLTIGSETPGSIVFNGAEFVSPALLPSMASGPSRPIVGPPMPNPDEAETPLLAQPEQTTSSPSTPTKPLPASLTDSPVPSPMLSHRRPVRDVVNSINRRGNVTPLSLFSPASQYSPAPVSPQGTSSRSSPVSRPSTMYEAVRRSTLTVANPDGRGDRMGSG